MTLDECTIGLRDFALALRAPVDGPTYVVYHRVLAPVPEALFLATVDALLRSGGLKWLPTAPELLTACERQRRAIVAAHPWEGCADCLDSHGWRTVHLESGQPSVQRCPCVARHAEQMARIAGGPVAALPAGRFELADMDEPVAGEWPAAIRDQVAQVAYARRMP